jgi:DNA-binding CsgD family transcriptional regulator
VARGAGSAYIALGVASPARRTQLQGADGNQRLLGRQHLLDAIEAGFADAAGGHGGALLVIGHAGMGKTALQDAAARAARARGIRVIRAAGAELEQNLAFGVAGQLLRSLLAEVTPRQRRALLADAPPRVLRLGEPGRDPAPAAADELLAVSYGLFTVLAGAVESSPALVAIDDLHWCDQASLELILYLLHRLDELQVAAVMAQRPASAEGWNEVLTRVGAHPRVRVEQLPALDAEAVGELLGAELGERVDPALVEVCREVTGGNPFYLQTLLRALAEDGARPGEELVRRARTLVPGAVARSLRVRVGRLGPEAAALARAVAVLGDEVPLRHAAILADLSIAQASQAADRLAAAGMLLPREPLRFVHPLVRQTIEQDVPAFERATRHLTAARLLYREGMGSERVAAHLLRGRGEGDPWAVGRLRAAARQARASSALRSAIRYLERALAEPPTPEERAAVLGELGELETALGLPQAAEHLTAAIAETTDRRRRAELALELGRSHDARGDHAAAARAFEQGLGELDPEPAAAEERELRDQLQGAFISAGTLVPAIRPRAAGLAASWLSSIPSVPASQGQRLLLAHAALEAVHAGEPAARVIELAERAWDGGRILKQAAPQWIGWRTVANALCCAGALERAAEVADAAIQDARRRGSPAGFATATFTRSSPLLLQGRITEAIADLEATRDSRRYGWSRFPRAAAAKWALCMLAVEQLDAAEAALIEAGELEEPYDLEDAMALHALAELRRHQGRMQEALATAIVAGRAAEQTLAFFDYCPWRSTAALAALALGDRERALAIAEEMLRRAARTGVVHRQIEALRVAGMCEVASGGLEKLEAAVALGRSQPPRLEAIASRVELGAALRRANERAAARLPLQEAADLARRGGALALYHRARTELAATGARPRREALLSGPASLTPSERRIAELAAAGHSNREIATSLFVTPKTVEYHLRNAYRKLDIQTRRELATALSA